ncbi:uncharacterized protein FIBRA_00957 [Fibroporia radiculosa]|uniref:RlpA-like protein double-psi beta-barrel domain-containing protein n=1 Tax=Fibroporia radiculosa TaxID=599839 RepID=J4H0U3_9APHY|nr:uncharacterized protein FIBRA_00957 [Fibroporia radiculosa]CCL98949.1 predicted protein [Fibroporia radiculosa]
MRPLAPSLSFLPTLLTLSLLGLVFADSGSNVHRPQRTAHGLSRRHNHIPKHLEKRAPYKRFSDARFTFFDAGQNACGSKDSNSDYIVALNSAQFNGGEYCYQKVTISYGGKSTQATVTDECPGCPYGGLDFSRGLFDYFAAESIGVLYGTWTFDDGEGSSSSSSPSAASTPTPFTTYSSIQPTTSWSISSSYDTPSPTIFSLLAPSNYSSSTLTFALPTRPLIPFLTSEATATLATALATPTPPAPAPALSLDQGSLNQFNVAIVSLSGLIEAANWA